MTRKTLLRNGTIIDGTGRPAYQGDLLISGDRIEAVGALGPVADAMEVDCTGMHVVPGFIDAHSHGDQEVLRRLPNKILQGVTTEVVGNCGFSLFPTKPHTPKMTGELFDGEPEEGMASVADYFQAVEAAGPSVNVAALTGHSALRVYAMGMRSDPPGEEGFRCMEHALGESLAAGALGFSTGLNCGPASFSTTAELVRLCGVVRRHGGYFTTHMRDYKFKVVEAVEEALRVGREAGVPVQISHMQVVGQKNWPKLDTAIEAIEKAAEEGIDVCMDAYPYLAGSCSLLQFLPKWCQTGGVSALLGHLESPGSRERIAAETDDGMSNTWDDIVVCGVRSATGRSLLGRSIARIAAARGTPPALTAMDLIREENGDLFVISFNNNEANLRKVLTHPLNSVITDGFVIDGGISHPRTFGTYPRFLGEFVRDKRWMSLDEAIPKTSSFAARRFRLKGRGELTPGAFADVTVFDYARIGSAADYEDPARSPDGIREVMVNGRFAVRDGVLTGDHAGRALRRA